MGAPDDYERSEALYLQALREGADRAKLASAAKAVSHVAGEWEAIAYREFFAARNAQGETAREVVEKEIEAEKAELLRELWADIATAHASDQSLAPR